jgi:L-alanine-DL-glutamate epimerase-like enolase superfamily enzyme
MGEQMKHIIQRVTATPLKVQSSMSWLGVDRSRVSAMCIVEVETDTGFIGHGFTNLADGSVVAQAIKSVAAPAIIGMPALATERTWRAMWWAMTAAAQTGFGANATSAVDLALWDIKGQVLERPVWQLLGASYDRLQVYATLGMPGLEPEQLVEMAKRLKELGFKTIKIQVGRPGLGQVDREKSLDLIIDEDIARIAALREALGPDFGLAIDGAARFDLPHAVTLSRRAAPYDISWYEEPVLQNDIELMAELRRMTDIPLSVGQNEGQLYRFRDMLVNKAVDMIQPNVAIIGGITQGVKAAALASAFNIPIASGGGSCPFHNAHLQAGIANGGKLEYQTSATGAYDPLFDNLPTIEDGWLALPQTPGFGFTPNKDAMKEFTVK